MTTQVHFWRRALCALFRFVGTSLFAKQPVLLEFYFQAGCGECEKVKALVLPRLNDAYSSDVEIRRYAIEDDWMHMTGTARVHECYSLGVENNAIWKKRTLSHQIVIAYKNH